MLIPFCLPGAYSVGEPEHNSLRSDRSPFGPLAGSTFRFAKPYSSRSGSLALQWNLSHCSIVFKDHTGPEGGERTVTDFAWTSGSAGSLYRLEYPVLHPPILRGYLCCRRNNLSPPSPLDTPHLVTGGTVYFRPPIPPDFNFGPPV